MANLISVSEVLARLPASGEQHLIEVPPAGVIHRSENISQEFPAWIFLNELECGENPA